MKEGVVESEADAPSMASLKNDDNAFGASTLYRLYHSGVRELNKRVAGRTVSAQHLTVLSAQSIEAIRASMDASNTRLQQTMSSQMVLLTIAISGGPFLGLLGTVVGVMITFAAIALSGDVNVNAHCARYLPPRWPPPSRGWRSPFPRSSATTGSIRVSRTSLPTTGCSWTNSSRASPNSTAEAAVSGSIDSGDKDVYDDINITPMLDLAYVLMVIFIIMTTASVQGIKVNLPKASDTPSLAKPQTKAITITERRHDVSRHLSGELARTRESVASRRKLPILRLPVVVKADNRRSLIRRLSMSSTS